MEAAMIYDSNLVAVEDNSFDLYVDRNYARYLSDWFVNSGEDPIMRDSKYHKTTVS